MDRITRRAYKLADGRDLIYFDDADTTLGPERGPDLREPAVRPPTATMRQDVLTGEWISIAAARQNRVVLPPSHLDPLAPASPDNPSEIPSRYDVAVFENKSPSFGPGLSGPVIPAPEHRKASMTWPGSAWDAAGSQWAAAKWCASRPNTRVPSPG
jgi:UDPglucose--hexose-1-phosphate uridylyltransferase